MTTKPMHLDGASIARAIDKAVTEGITGAEAGAVQDAIDAAVAAAVAALVADNVPDADTSDVVSPADVAYTQADQTALADTVVALGDTVNALIAAMVAAGLMADA